MDFLDRYLKLKKEKEKKKPKVIVVGRSNVGKSTLIRLLTGRKDVRVGKKPGVTLKINEYDLGDYILVDMPGFGYMAGLPKKVEEKIKDDIVRYIEENSDNISAGILVIDSKSFLEIIKRWDERGEIPIDIDMFNLITDLKISPIIVANKMDKIKKSERDKILDNIAKAFNCSPPWKQWKFIVPACLKKGDGLEEIKKLIRERVEAYKKIRG